MLSTERLWPLNKPSAGATPDPIPNSVVKHCRADDTVGTDLWPGRCIGGMPVPLTAWESRTPPELIS